MSINDTIETFNMGDPEQAARAMQMLYTQIANLENSVQILSTILGLSIGIADNPGHPKINLSAALSAILDRADETGRGCYLVDTLRQALKIGSEPPEPNGRATGDVVRLFQRVNAKAA